MEAPKRAVPLYRGFRGGLDPGLASLMLSIKKPQIKNKTANWLVESLCAWVIGHIEQGT